MKTRTVTFTNWIVELIYDVDKSCFIPGPELPGNVARFATRELARSKGRHYRRTQGCRYVTHKLTAQGTIPA